MSVIDRIQGLLLSPHVRRSARLPRVQFYSPTSALGKLLLSSGVPSWVNSNCCPTWEKLWSFNGHLQKPMGIVSRVCRFLGNDVCGCLWIYLSKTSRGIESGMLCLLWVWVREDDRSESGGTTRVIERSRNRVAGNVGSIPRSARIRVRASAATG